MQAGRVLVILAIAVVATTQALPVGFSLDFDFNFDLNIIFKEGASGSEIVESTLEVIKKSGIFSSDLDNYIRSLACAESNDGKSDKTYRLLYFGGIWQVDYIAFLQLKLPSNKKILSNQLAAINSALGIQWNTVIWAELRKPLYSALGAYLYTTLQVVKNEGGVAPVTIEQQAVFWKKYYRSGGDVEAFKQCEIKDSVTDAPTEAPPTEAPPTEAPPTEAPPTEAPPTEAPPTDAPPADATFNCADQNPCTPENAAAGLFYFPADDQSQFVQCSEWGQCYVMNCPAGLVWDADVLSCNWP